MTLFYYYINFIDVRTCYLRTNIIQVIYKYHKKEIKNVTGNHSLICCFQRKE